MHRMGNFWSGLKVLFGLFMQRMFVRISVCPRALSGGSKFVSVGVQQLPVACSTLAQP